MKFQYIFRLIIIPAFFLAFSSCQKVIQIDLNSADPHIVIEGNINDQPAPYTIKISRTVNFDQNNIFPHVTGAQVIITDNTGLVDTLKEVSSGIYQTTKTIGYPGYTYNLSVKTDGNTYISSGTMPSPVTIDTLTVQTTPGSGPGSGGKPNKQIRVLFKDQPGVVNYYRIVLKVNDSILNAIRVVTDQFRDGENFNVAVRGEDYQINSGDSIKVYLQTIDKKIYDYFRALDNQGGGIQQSGSPANPPTNLSGDALGYFNVYSVRTKTIRVP